MSDYPILLREGPFYKSDEGALLVAGSEDVGVLLAPFEGQRVRIAAHHLPPVHVDVNRWGGGSCLWQDTNLPCPAGHRERPSWLYNVSAEGVLVNVRPGVWSVAMLNGSTVALDLGAVLPGHTGRVACALLADVEGMRDALGVSAEMVSGLGVRATDLRDLMSQLHKITGG